MTEYRVPGLEGEDEELTFAADDHAGEAISFAWLITLGRERAEGVAWVCDVDEGAIDELPAPDPDVGEHHRWAWDFARECLTNYDTIVHGLMQPGVRPPCERCYPVEHETVHLLGSLAMRRGPLCDDCVRRMFVSLKALRRRLDLLEAAVAAWARARWPELVIRESSPGALDDALDQIQESVIADLQEQRDPLN